MGKKWTAVAFVRVSMNPVHWVPRRRRRSPRREISISIVQLELLLAYQSIEKTQRFTKSHESSISRSMHLPWFPCIFITGFVTSEIRPDFHRTQPVVVFIGNHWGIQKTNVTSGNSGHYSTHHHPFQLHHGWCGKKTFLIKDDKRCVTTVTWASVANWTPKCFFNHFCFQGSFLQSHIWHQLS